MRRRGRWPADGRPPGHQGRRADSGLQLRPAAGGRVQRLTPARAGTVVFIASVVVVAVIVAAQSAWSRPCSTDQPCAPDALGSIVIGGLLVLPFLGWLRLTLAAIVAFAVELGAVADDLLHPADALILTHVTVVPLAVLCALLAWRVPTTPPVRRAMTRQYLRAGALIATGLALVGVTVHRQSTADAQMRSANIVTVTVTERPDSSTIVVDQQGTVRRLEVIDSNAYAVGSRQRLAVDDAGLQQLVSEPYDATPLLSLAVFALVIGAGWIWRLREAVEAPDPAAGGPWWERLREQLAPDSIWPDVGAESFLVIIGAVVAAFLAWKRILQGLVALVCGTGDCRTWSMPLIGWAAIALPFLMMAAIYLLAKPRLLGAWGLIVSFSLLAFDLVMMFIVKNAAEDPRQHDFFDAHPGVSALLIGFWCAFGGVVLLGPLPLVLKGSQRLRFHGAPSALPLLVIAGGQLLALPFALWFGRPTG
jgi:uncharacterized membrane protein